jgi:hypothetical protein
MSELQIKIGRKAMDQIEKLIGLQMLGHSVIGCARLMNLSRQSIYEIMKNPIYIATKQREQSEILTSTHDAVIAGALDGVRHLQDLVTDFRQKPADRMQAALALVGLAEKFTQAKQVDPQSESLAKVVFPEVVADEPEPVKELPASTSTFEEHFNSLHLPAEKTGV